MSHKQSAPATVLKVGRIRIGAVCLAISGLLFSLFPLVRPSSDSSSAPLVVAQAFSSPAWVLAHALVAVALVLLPLGLLGVYFFVQGTNAERRTFQGLVLSWIGIGLLLPIAGTEAFALRAVGQEAVSQSNGGLISLTNSIRFGPAIGFFLSGLVLLGIGGTILAFGIWRSGNLPRWSGVVLGIGLALFLPALPLFIRMLDGFSIGLGSIWIAVTILRYRRDLETT